MTASLARIGAIATRIITQFRRDPRTIALIFVAPVLVMTLLGYVITEKSAAVTIGLVEQDEGFALSLGQAPTAGAQPGTPPAGGPGTVPIRVGPLFERLLAERGLEPKTYDDPALMLQDIRDGKLRGGVVIPKEFTANLVGGKGFDGLRLVVEGSDALLSGDIARRYALALQALPAELAEERRRLVPPEWGLPAAPATPQLPGAEYVYGGADLGALSYFAPGYVAFFAFFFTFLLTSVSFLRERASGTMERLLASPVKRGEIVVGYLLGFGLFALIQSLVILLFSVYALGVKLAGSLAAAFTVEAALVAVAVVMGIFFSFYARNELQVIQFIPIVIIPQVVLSGFFTPVETMWEPLRWLAYAMPMTYANEALRSVIVRGWSLESVGKELAVLGGFAVLFALLASRLIKRQVA